MIPAKKTISVSITFKAAAAAAEKETKPNSAIQGSTNKLTAAKTAKLIVTNNANNIS